MHGLRREWGQVRLLRLCRSPLARTRVTSPPLRRRGLFRLVLACSSLARPCRDLLETTLSNSKSRSVCSGLPKNLHSRSPSVCKSRVSHCQTTNVCHPPSSSLRNTSASRRLFASIFGPQYSSLDLGNRPLAHACPCQKHPWTRMARGRDGKTRSGRPGSCLTCSL